VIDLLSHLFFLPLFFCVLFILSLHGDVPLEYTHSIHAKTFNTFNKILFFDHAQQPTTYMVSPSSSSNTTTIKQRTWALPTAGTAIGFDFVLDWATSVVSNGTVRVTVGMGVASLSLRQFYEQACVFLSHVRHVRV
jgi:hypothetical protein